MKTFYSFLFVLLGITSATGANRAFVNVLEFDASNAQSYVDCASQAAFTPVNFTIELWVNITGTVGGATILSNGGTVSSKNQGYTIRINTTTKRIEATIGYGINVWLLCAGTGDPLVYGEWTHIAMTNDGDSVRIYLNGVPNSATALSGNTIMTSTKKLYIAEHPSFAGRRVSGQMSDIRIWDYARTQAEIQSAMNDFLTEAEEGLVANWKLNQTEGTEVAELTETYPATRNSGTTWVTNITSSKKNSVLADEVSIWPSHLAAGDILHVKSEKKTAIRIYSTEGKMFYNTSSEDGVTLIETKHLKSGMYFVSLVSGTETRTAKFVIR